MTTCLAFLPSFCLLFVLFLYSRTDGKMGYQAKKEFSAKFDENQQNDAAQSGEKRRIFLHKLQNPTEDLGDVAQRPTGATAAIADRAAGERVPARIGGAGAVVNGKRSAGTEGVGRQMSGGEPCFCHGGSDAV